MTTMRIFGVLEKLFDSSYRRVGETVPRRYYAHSFIKWSARPFRFVGGYYPRQSIVAERIADAVVA